MALASEVCIWQDHLFFYFAGLPWSLLSSRFPLSSLLASELNQNRGSPIRLHCGVPFSLVNVKPTRITRYSAHALDPWRRVAHERGSLRLRRDFQTPLGGPASRLARQLLCPPPQGTITVISLFTLARVPSSSSLLCLVRRLPSRPLSNDFPHIGIYNHSTSLPIGDGISLFSWDLAGF